MTTSLWIATADQAQTYPSLSTDVDVDVIIIGGGITGITAAYELNRQGKKVALLEAHLIGSGTTAYSTGNLYVPVQPYFQNVIAKFNVEVAKQVAQSRQLAIDHIEKIVAACNINCHFGRRPWFLYASQKKEINFLDKEIAALKAIQMPIEEVSELPLPIPFKKAICLHQQARFNPYQYVIKLAEYLQTKGVLIFENTRAIEIAEQESCVVKTKAGQIHARAIFIATHTPCGINTVQLFTAPYRSYVVAAKTNQKNLPEGHFWDLSAPHHATCTHPEFGNEPELLLVAGSHHKTGQDQHAEKNFSHLEKFLEKNFQIEKIAYQWSAQHYQSADDIPYIGLAHKHSKHVYMATGYFADGLVYGTLAGQIIADCILGKANPFKNTYHAQRIKPFASLPFLLKENSNVFLQYMKDVPLMHHQEIKAIKKNEAKIIEINRQKLAVYRDNDDKLHIVSAVCTHMKCIIGWNDAERTWDCPCHGSRFSVDGDVIEGPAIASLTKKHPEDA